MLDGTSHLRTTSLQRSYPAEFLYWPICYYSRYALSKIEGKYRKFSAYKAKILIAQIREFLAYSFREKGISVESKTPKIRLLSKN